MKQSFSKKSSRDIEIRTKQTNLHKPKNELKHPCMVIFTNPFPIRQENIFLCEYA
jgi:hypothetical protein